MKADLGMSSYSGKLVSATTTVSWHGWAWDTDWVRTGEELRKLHLGSPPESQ